MGGSISKLVYQPPQEATYVEEGDDFEIIWLETRLGNRIPAFHIDTPKSRFMVLYSHGNAEDLGIAHDWAAQFCQRLGVSMLAYDYSGYGLASGKPSEKATYADVEAAYKYCVEDLRIPTTRMVLYGRSLGSGPTVELASRLGPAGCLAVVLHTPLASAFRVAVNVGFTMPGDMYASIDKASKVTFPTLVLHGTADEVVPYSHGTRLHAALPDAREPWWVEGGMHNDLELRWRGEYYSRVRDFLKEVEPGATAEMPISERRAREKRERERRRKEKEETPAASLGEVLRDETDSGSEGGRPVSKGTSADAGGAMLVPGPSRGGGLQYGRERGDKGKGSSSKSRGRGERGSSGRDSRRGGGGGDRSRSRSRSRPGSDRR